MIKGVKDMRKLETKEIFTIHITIKDLYLGSIRSLIRKRRMGRREEDKNENGRGKRRRKRRRGEGEEEKEWEIRTERQVVKHLEQAFYTRKKTKPTNKEYSISLLTEERQIQVKH